MQNFFAFVLKTTNAKYSPLYTPLHFAFLKFWHQFSVINTQKQLNNSSVNYHFSANNNQLFNLVMMPFMVNKTQKIRNQNLIITQSIQSSLRNAKPFLLASFRKMQTLMQTKK